MHHPYTTAPECPFELDESLIEELVLYMYYSVSMF